jgi:TorA-specific chaperone
MMQETHTTSDYETRASLYWWFATLLTHELTAEQLAHYQTDSDGRALLLSLGQDETLAPAVNQMLAALNKLVLMSRPELELAADFSQLFLTDSKAGAPPYASVYHSKSGLLFQQPHHDMQAALNAQGLAIDSHFNEPADHIAIQLDYLGNLIMREGEQSNEKQLEFIQTQIMTWLPSWVNATAKVHNSGFYQGVAQLLLAFLKQDISDTVIAA